MVRHGHSNGRVDTCHLEIASLHNYVATTLPNLIKAVEGENLADFAP